MKILYDFVAYLKEVYKQDYDDKQRLADKAIEHNDKETYWQRLGEATAISRLIRLLDDDLKLFLNKIYGDKKVTINPIVLHNLMAEISRQLDIPREDDKQPSYINLSRDDIIALPLKDKINIVKESLYVCNIKVNCQKCPLTRVIEFGTFLNKLIDEIRGVDNGN